MKTRLSIAFLAPIASVALVGGLPSVAHVRGGLVQTAPLQSTAPRPDISAIEPADPEVQSDTRLPTLACLPGKSLNISIGTPGWKLKLPDGSLSSIVPLSSQSWPLLTGAQWQGPPNGDTVSFPVGDYLYGLKVMIEPCKGPAPALEVKYMSDNQATLILDGAVIQQQGGTPYYGFLPGSLTSYHQVLPATLSGIHTLVVRVENRSGPNKPYATPTGVSARIILSR